MRVDTSRIKFIPQRSDTMSTEDTLREIVAYVELTKDAYDLNKKGFQMYSRKSFTKFCDNIMSIVKQEIY